MTKEEFKVHFECFTDEFGNKVGRGNLDNAYTCAEYAISTSGTTFETICSKWDAYIKQCIANKTADQYIKTMESFIDKKGYEGSYGGSLKQLQPSFLDKYKPADKSLHDQVKLNIEKIKEHICNQPEGDFSQSPDDTEQDKDNLLKAIKEGNPQWCNAHNSFVIKRNKDGSFTKIMLNL